MKTKLETTGWILLAWLLVFAIPFFGNIIYNF